MTLSMFVEMVARGFCGCALRLAFEQLDAPDQARWALRSRRKGQA